MPDEHTIEELRDIAEEYRVVAAHMSSLEVRRYWLRMAEVVERRLEAVERSSATSG